MNKTAFQRLKSKTKNFLHQLVHNSSNLHVVGRDHNHLENVYRRKITSPDNAVTEVMEMLADDELFIDALGTVPGEYLVRVALIGEEIRANIFRLERFPSGPLTPVYNEDWRKSDILDFKVDMVRGESSFSRNFAPLRRPVITDLTYDRYEPEVSYVRQLTYAEMAKVALVSMPNATQMA